MIVLDAGVLIAVLDAEDAHHAWAENLIATTAGERLSASALTLAESLVHPTAQGRGHVAEDAVRRLGVEIVSLVEEDARALADVRSSSGLRMPDAIVVLLAERTTAAVATTDHRVARIADDRGLLVHVP